MGFRTFLTALAVAIVGLGCVADAAWAGDLDLVIGEDSAGYRANGSGEYTVSGYDSPWTAQDAAVTSTDAGVNFNTFCIEKEEPIVIGGTFCYTVDDVIKYNDDFPNTTNLEEDSALLFYAYWTNQWTVGTEAAALVGGVYDLGTGVLDDRGEDGKAVQQALWRIQGQTTDTSARSDEFEKYASGLSWAALGVNGNNVKVVNLFKNGINGEVHKQSVLVVVPLPAPALMGLALLGGLGLISVVRRRRRATL